MNDVVIPAELSATLSATVAREFAQAYDDEGAALLRAVRYH